MPGVLIRQVLRPGALQLKALARQDLTQLPDCNAVRSSAMSIQGLLVGRILVRGTFQFLIRNLENMIWRLFIRLRSEAMAACPWRFPWTYRQLLASEYEDLFPSTCVVLRA